MLSFVQILILGVSLLLVWVVFTYNRLIRLSNRVKEAWSDIEVQLKRRADLIPNLVNTVKGYKDFEQQTLQRVVEARGKALGAGDQHERMLAENELSQALSRLLVLVENYPELKASQNFLQLQTELRDTEDRIQASRRFYNSVVKEYNVALESFPSNLIASLFSFKKAEYFDVPDHEISSPPEVKL